MAVFSVNISDEDVGRVITAVCGNYGYQSQIENPNFDPFHFVVHWVGLIHSGQVCCPSGVG